MDGDLSATQICVSCGSEFISEKSDPIPVCPNCEMEEQRTTVNASLDDERTHTTTTTATRAPIQLKVAPAPTSSAAPLGSGWKVRKLDGRIFGPFPTETIREWASQGKILADEDVARMDAKGSEVWEPIGRCVTFAHLYAPEPAPLRPAAHLDLEPLPDLTPKPKRPVISDLDIPPPPDDDAAFSLQLEAPEEDTMLFSQRAANRGAGLRKALTVIGVGLAVVLLVGAVMQLPWRRWIAQRAAATSQKNREPDRVGQYIDNFKKEIGPVQGAAQTFYEQGLNFWNAETMEGWEKSERAFKSALVLDNDHVGALAGLAETYAQLASLRLDTDLFTVAYDLADKAMRLDPQNAHANRAKAQLFIRLNNSQNDARPFLDKSLTLKSEDPWTHALYGEWALQQRKFDEAATHFEKALSLKPDLESAQYRLGLVRLRSSQYWSAGQTWVKIRSDAAQHGYYAALARLELARLYMRLGGTRTAFDYVKEARALDPLLVDAALLEAQIMIHFQNTPKQAEAALTAFLTDAPGITEVERRNVQTLLAVAQAAQGKQREALATLKTVLDKDDHFRMARYNFGIVSLAAGDREAAVKAFEALRGWNEAPLLFPYHAGRTQAAFDDRVQEAIQTFQDLVNTAPDLPHGHVGLARVLAKVSNERGWAENLWHACQTRLDYLDDHEWRTLMAVPADLDLPAFIKMQEKLLQKDDFSVEALAGYAYLLALSGARDQAIAVLEKALVQDPQDIPVLTLYAHLLNRSGRSARAVEFMRTALKANPQDIAVLTVLSEGYLAQGKFTLAKAHLETVLELPRATARGHYLMGQVSKGLGDRAKAISYWTEALKRDPNMISPKVALFEVQY